MNIFIAGAGGAVGRALIPLLVRNGHTVTGTTRTPAKAAALRELGAEPVIVDGLDRAAVLDAVAAAGPEAIVHQMTALAGLTDLRRFERAFAMTNRLRTEGTEHLLAAARATGVERVVAQSYAGWPYARTGGPVKTEDDPLDSDPPKGVRTTLDAMCRLEAMVGEAGGTILRYGGFYGPGTGMAPAGDQWETIRARRFPIVGDGGGVWSFCHIEDAASATLAALEAPAAGELYNVCDDDPAPVREWLPAMAAAMGAPPPRHIPRWVGRLMGAHIVSLMSEVRGASNAKLRRELGWAPSRPSWRDGVAELAAVSPGAPAREAS